MGLGFRWTGRLVAAVSLGSMLVACGSDGSSNNETTGGAGAAGSAGSIGIAGADGNGGRAGSSASGGSAGSSAGGGGSGTAGTNSAPSTETQCQSDGRCTRATFQQWGARHTYQAYSVAFDSTGNVYALSNRGVGNLPALNKHIGYFDVGLVKFDAKAEFAWARIWGTPGYDNGGDVFITNGDQVKLFANVTAGESGDPTDAPYTLLGKISPTGEELSTSRWDAGTTVDTPTSMRMHADGTLVAIGLTAPGKDGNDTIGGPHDVFATRIAADGNQWTQRWGTSRRDYVSGSTIDSKGNVYVLGTTDGAFPGATNDGSHFHAFVAKLSTTSELLWVKQWAKTEAESITGVQISGEQLYIAGQTPKASVLSSDSNIFISQLDLDGKELWKKELDVKHTGSNVVLGVGENGRLYLVFDAEADLPNGHPRSVIASDLYLTEWTETGDMRWLFSWGSDSHDYAFDIATYKNRVAVVGRAQESMPGFSAGEGAFMTLFEID